MQRAFAEYDDTIQTLAANGPDEPTRRIVSQPGKYSAAWTVRVRTSTRTHLGALLVPQRAVTELQGSYQVAVVDRENKISIRTVKVGDRTGTPVNQVSKRRVESPRLTAISLRYLLRLSAKAAHRAAAALGGKMRNATASLRSRLGFGRVQNRKPNPTFRTNQRSRYPLPVLAKNNRGEAPTQKCRRPSRARATPVDA